MFVLLTCKNEKDLIENEGASLLIRLYINFSDIQGQLTPQSVVESSRNPNSSKLVFVTIVTCKNGKDSSKNEGARVLTTFLPL